MPFLPAMSTQELRIRTGQGRPEDYQTGTSGQAGPAPEGEKPPAGESGPAEHPPGPAPSP